MSLIFGEIKGDNQLVTGYIQCSYVIFYNVAIYTVQI